MSSDQHLEEHANTHYDSWMDLVYKKWAIELADYIAKLQIEEEEKYVYGLAEEVTAWWEEIDLDCNSSDSCSFEEGDEGDDLEEKIRQYKLDLRCNMQ